MMYYRNKSSNLFLLKSALNTLFGVEILNTINIIHKADILQITNNILVSKHMIISILN